MSTEVNIQKCNICLPSDDISLSEDFQRFQKQLPEGYEYLICILGDYSFVKDGTPYFHAVFKTKIKDEEGAKEWIAKYQEKSLSTWRIVRTFPNSGTKNICRIERKCQHNTGRGSKDATRRTKNTGCPALLTVRVKKTIFPKKNGKTERKCRSKDQHIPEWPCTITFHHHHNHALNDANILAFRDVSPVIRDKLLRYFEKGHTPSTALSEIKRELKEEHGENFPLIEKDRHYCPDMQYCYRLYYEQHRRDTGVIHGPKHKETLEQRIESFNDENGNCIKVDKNGGDTIIAIVTPFMKRAHSLIQQSEQMIFVDSTEKNNMRAFTLLTDCGTGGLPLGCFITTGLCKTSVEKGLNMLKEILGEDAFNGKGDLGPSLFLTENLEPIQKALLTVYPQSEQVICVFFILQSFWGFLFNDSSLIPDEDRLHLFSLMKSLILSTSELELDLRFQSALSDFIARQHNQVIHYFQTIFGKRTSWAVCHANFVVEGDGNTNNFCDLAMWILKDKFIHRAKVSSMLQLVDIIITKMDGFYKQRLQDIAHNRISKAFQARYVHSSNYIQKLRDYIVQEPSNVYLVPKEKDEASYHKVDMTVGLCSCPLGSVGGPCKHQLAILKYFNSDDLLNWRFHGVVNQAQKNLLLSVVEGDPLLGLDKLSDKMKALYTKNPELYKSHIVGFVERALSLVNSDEKFLCALDIFGRKSLSCDQEAQESHVKELKRKIENLNGSLDGSPKKHKTNEANKLSETQTALATLGGIHGGLDAPIGHEITVVEGQDTPSSSVSKQTVITVDPDVLTQLQQSKISIEGFITTIAQLDGPASNQGLSILSGESKQDLYCIGQDSIPTDDHCQRTALSNLAQIAQQAEVADDETHILSTF